MPICVGSEKFTKVHQIAVNSSKPAQTTTAGYDIFNTIYASLQETPRIFEVQK